MNALDAILSLNCQVATALERTARPNLKDVKEARDASKKQTKIADAAVALLEEGIYEVADRPIEDTPLFNTSTGQPAAGVQVEPEAPAAEPEAPAGEPVPDLTLPTLGMAAPHPLDGFTEDQALAAFEKKLEEVEVAWKDGGKTLKAFKGVRKAWVQRYDHDARAAYTALVSVLETPGTDFLPPQQVEPPPAPAPVADRLEGEPDWDNTTQVDLEEAFEYGPLGEIVSIEVVAADRVTLRNSWIEALRRDPRAAWRAALTIIADDKLPLEVPEALKAAQEGSAA